MVEQLAATLPDALTVLERLRPIAGGALPTPQAVTRCAARVGSLAAACARGQRTRGPRCTRVFAAAAERLWVLADQSDGLPALVVGAERAARIALLMRAAAREGRTACGVRDARTETERVAAVVTPVDRGRRLEVEPARPLALDSVYDLEAPLPATVLGTVPRADARGTLHFEAAVPPPSDVPGAIVDFRLRLFRTMDAARSTTVRPAVILTLSRPLGLSEIPVTRMRFRRGGGRASQFRVATGPERLAPAVAPARAAALAAAPSLPQQDSPPTAMPHVRGVVRTDFSSFDLDRGVPAPVTAWLALPRRTPKAMAILLSGYRGKSRTMLGIHGDGLAARGVMPVTIDLPGHGTREGPIPFLDPLDPAALARHIRQAVADVVALVAALRAGLGAPSERAVLASLPIELFGYSLGAVVGALALAIEPRLDAAVLVAPTGDLTSWLQAVLFLKLVPLLTCAGAGAHGELCGLPEHACAPTAACVINPALFRATDVLTAYRSLLADVDPQRVAAAVPGADQRRPILILEGGRDGIIPPSATEWLAAAIGADPTCGLRAERPQVLCRFPDLDHSLVDREGPRTLIYEFLASGGRSLGGAEVAASLAAR